MTTGSHNTATRAPQLRLRPWQFVVSFGLVSLFADMVYEGARSIIGPYLATLGASALVVSVAAGAGEFIGYGLRVISGYLVQRSRHYWTWTIVGYTLTVLSVPLIGATHLLAPALLMYGTERLGKAVRSPAKDTLLSHASTQTGRGSAFGVHQAMDQFGAMAGPLLLALVLATHAGDYRLAFGVLMGPGIIVLALLTWLHQRVPDPSAYENDHNPTASPEPATTDRPSGPDAVEDVAAAAKDRPRLPPLLWRYVAVVAVLSCGIASFPLLAFHAQTQGLLPAAQVPVLFAVAMAVDGLSGLVMGGVYDRRGPQVLLVVPVVAAFAAVAFTHNTPLIWIGVAVWGVVNGVLDSTVKAVVTELVTTESRAAAFGWLALVRGLGLLIAGVALGLAYDYSVSLVIWLILGANAIALLGLKSVLDGLNDPELSAA